MFNFTPFPIISTERLLLRQLQTHDAQNIHLLRSDPEVNKYLNRPVSGGQEDGLAFIEKINKGISEGEWIFWAICRKDETELIGTICLWNISAAEKKGEIGYELLPAAQGMGYMSESLPPILQFGFEKMDLDRILADLSPDNKSSLVLLEKNGFTFKSKGENTVLYQLRRSDFGD